MPPGVHGDLLLRLRDRLQHVLRRVPYHLHLIPDQRHHLGSSCGDHGHAGVEAEADAEINISQFEMPMTGHQGKARVAFLCLRGGPKASYKSLDDVRMSGRNTLGTPLPMSLGWGEIVLEGVYYKSMNIYTLRPQLNWIEHQTSDLGVEGSNPSGRAS